MPSQGSQESIHSGPLCLTLSKLSYATVSNENVSPIPWVHLSSKSNLFAVFETIRIQGPQGHLLDQRMLKVMKDPEIVENLDLDRLASAAQAEKDRIRDPRCHDRTLKVAIVVKAPAIAVRYPCEQSQIRRFQIRFVNEEDYYEAMKLFARAKIPTEEAGSFVPRRPTAAQSTTSSISLRPSDSISQLSIRPASASSNVTVQPAWENPSLRENSVGSQKRAGQIGLGQPQTMPPPPFPATPAGQLGAVEALSCDISPNRPEFERSPFFFPPIENNDTIARQSPFTPTFNPPGPVQGATPPMTSPCRPINSSFAERPTHINLYEPRPLPAPMRETQRLSQILPPDRELPFSKSKVRSGPVQISPNSQSLDTSSTVVISTQEVPAPAENAISTSKRKWTAMKKAAQPSPAKKPRVSAAAKKKAETAATSQEKQESRVPSVEELLEHFSPSDGATTDVRAPAIDTQTLLTRYEERQAAAATPVDEVGGILALTMPAFANDHLSTMTTAVNETTVTPLSTPPSRPQLAALDPNVPTAARSTQKRQEQAQPMTTPSPAPITDPAFAPAVTFMDASTTAIQPDTPVDYKDLSSSQQNELLETWCCDNLRDPGFEQLCKRMEGMWVRHLLLG